MSTPEVSVIVPVYNSADTIASCLESILRQSMHNLELIVVNDGSTDGSGHICDHYAASDHRVQVIHQPNKGRTEARAVGTARAIGRWISYVDSDDRLPIDSLRYLYQKATDDVDIVLGNGYTLGQERRTTIPIADFRHLAVRAEGTIGVPWGSLYRRSIVKPQVFQIPRDIVNGEDYLFWLRLVFITDKPVNVVVKAVYDKGPEHTSNTFVWTADYCQRLNELRKASIPKEQHGDFFSDMLADRLANMFSVAVCTPRKEWEDSTYYKELLSDMKAMGTMARIKSKLFFALPSRDIRKMAGAVKQRISTIALMMCICLSAAAQGTADSTDVFYRHLKISELTVTGVAGQTKMHDMPAPVSVVTPRELRSSVGTNIVDVLSREPGLSQITTGSGIAKPIIRGLGYNRVLVVSDGVRQEGQQWGDEHGLELDAQAVHTAEILKGPASLMYGSDAMAGVLILHDSPTLAEGETMANVSTGYQSNSGLFDYSLHAAANQHGFVWDARYSEKMAHEYKSPADGYVPGTQMHERAGSLTMGMKRQWGHSLLKWRTYHLTPSIAEGGRDALTGLLEHDYDLKTYHKQLPFQQVKHYKATWDNAVHLGGGMLKAVVAYQQNRRQEYEETATEPDLFFRLHTATYDIRYQLATAATRHNGSTNPGPTLAVGIGGMYQKSENLAEENLIPDYHLFDVGGYATAQQTLGQWTMSGGLRADNRHIHDYGNFSGITGSVGAVWRVVDNEARTLNARINMARGFRAPNMSELGSDGVHEGTLRYEIGNKSLKPEYSWQADLGGEYQDEHVSAQLSIFLNRIENYIFAHRIDQVVEPGYRTYTFTQGDAMLKGFEASIDVHPVHRLHFGNTFSFVDAQQRHQPRSTRYLPMTPAPRWTSDVKYEITHRGHVLNNCYVALGLECFLEQNHFYEADDTETRTPSYTLFNISAGTDVFWRGHKWAEVYLTVQNFFNRAYQNHLSRLKYTDANTLTDSRGICNPGRNITIKLVMPIAL